MLENSPGGSPNLGRMETMALKRVGGTNVLAVEGDVARQPVEAVVNSANERLHHDAGVATAIVRTGGRVIQEESDAWVRTHGPVAPGTAAVTTGGMLQASHVIHAVGPQYGNDTSDEILAAAVTAALDAAASNGLRSIAFPMLCTGERGYPPDETASVITHTVEGWLTTNPDTLVEVRLVGFTRKQAELFAGYLTAE